MVKRTLFTFLSIYFVIGCSDPVVIKKNFNQPHLTLAEEQRLILLDTGYLYPVSSAQSDAQKIADQLNAVDRKGRKISNVLKFSIPDTLRFPNSSLEKRKNDPGFYVFNFSENNGFAFISGDKRISRIIAFTGSGNIDESPHTGLRIYMSRIVDYVQAQRKRLEAMRGDTAYVSLIKKLNMFHSPAASEKDQKNQRQQSTPCQQQRGEGTVPCTSSCSLPPLVFTNSTSIVNNIVVQPLIKTMWDQTPPYNNNFASGCNYQSHPICSSLYGNSNYYAGCVPVSEAQVIAFYYAKKYPAWQAITATDICSMNSTQVDNVASLIKSVYNQYWFKFMNCTDGTFTFDANLLSITNERGISPAFGLVQGEWRDYNNGDLENSLRNGSPVIVRGSQHQWCAFFNWGCAPDPTCMHQWIMDGLQTISQVTSYTVYPIDYTNCKYLTSSYNYTASTLLSTYVHNNWGWGNDGDGWYFEGQFGGTTDVFGNTNDTESNNAFNHNDKIIAYITAQ